VEIARVADDKRLCYRARFAKPLERGGLPGNPGEYGRLDGEQMRLRPSAPPVVVAAGVFVF
jgi:hypothetical protein